MKIDRSKIKKSTTDAPAECKVLIEKLKVCPKENLLNTLREIRTWTYGKCELYHWADILDQFDEVLEVSCKKEIDTQWTLPCDRPGHEKDKEVLLQVLQFTAMLIEHSFSRHLYNSMEHLTTLLSSSDMTVVLAVLNLLYVFSKRSNFITRLSADKIQGLVVRLTHLAESWGGKENGFGLALCCQNLPMSSFPASATTLHFEFYAETKKEDQGKRSVNNVLSTIHMENLDQMTGLPSELMEELVPAFSVPEDKQMLLFTHIRLAHCFSRYERRLQCVQARLQAISILVYSNSIGENANALLYNDLIEELVDILEVKDPKLMEIKAASLRTLTSIIHLDRHPKINQIIDVTGASFYHGFLPVLVRNCIQHMIEPDLEPFPQPFATALFSFLYHLSSYESGGEALVSCGMMESLLKVINWFGDGQEHITFVTRAVRVVDLITNLDMTAFQSLSGLTAFINRLEHEVDVCRKEQPFVIRTVRSESTQSIEAMPTSPPPAPEVAMETETAPGSAVNEGASTSAASLAPVFTKTTRAPQCFAQRAALLKSMLNFLKKAIPDPAISESIRHLMDGSLPRSLKHIVSNAEYYGPSLFLLATDVVTVYVFQEPSLLSSLQDIGLTDVVLHALLVKDVPATREVLASLPNVFSALCLNNRGLAAFVECKPFSRLFKVLLSPDYLPAMRRRRSSDPLGDTASNLGNAMDELMRHQPSLRTEATKAIIMLLQEVCNMGRDPKYICQKQQTTAKLDSAPSCTIRSGVTNDASSDEDDDDDDETGSQRGLPKSSEEAQSPTEPEPANSEEKIPVPLMDYVLNVMKFVEAILSNNTTDDHCREFVTQKGLIPLMGILGLPNLPIDFPASPSCQAVASVCKSVLTLSHEPEVLKQGLTNLMEVLESLAPLHSFVAPPGGSGLLQELAAAPNPTEAISCPQSTPLLHGLSATHAYIMMFVHVCKVGQNDIRNISVNHWGSELGLKVLEGLSRLYTSLVWESTVLLALCSQDILPTGCEFGKSDMDKLIPKDLVKCDKSDKTDEPVDSSPPRLKHSIGETGSNGVSAAMETLSTSESAASPMDMGEASTSNADSPESKKQDKGKGSPALQAQMKLIKPLLSASSKLGRALAELFGLLVKLSVGSPVRQRRTNQLPNLPQVPTPAAKAVASSLTKLLASGLSWQPPKWSPVPKLRLTFLICSVGFTSPMLFDEKKFPYHLMLQKFLSSGGQDALFDSFHWALSCRTKQTDGEIELPDGTGEFLDAWLMLVEKMVNTKNILESPHSLPSKPSIGSERFTPFNPLLYLINTHKAAFAAVTQLWNMKPLKVYGPRMSESILSILCHIIKGESAIREKYNKEKAAAPGKADVASTPDTSSAAASGPSSVTPSASAAAPAAQEPPVNQDHLQQLMDMGFSREHAIDAIQNTSSLEQATEYCLTRPPPLPPAMQQVLNMDLDMSEEDQMLRAIAMSLGENVLVSTDPQTAKPKEGEAVKKEEAVVEDVDKQVDEEPLEKAVLDQFTEAILPGCMQLLDTLPESVYRVCDLLVVVANRNSSSWWDDVLTSLVVEMAELCLILNEVAMRPVTEDKDAMHKATLLSTKPEAAKLAVRLHLFTLLFEEMNDPCNEDIENSGMLELLVGLLEAAQKCLTAAKEAPTPKWAAPLLLLLDLYEKVSVSSKRKAAVQKLVADCHTWKWFDDRNGRWCNYSASNNKSIDDAYRAGESSVRFTAARRRYIVQFTTMVQVNEETGNRRPVMLSLAGKEEKSKDSTATVTEGKEDNRSSKDKASSAVNQTDAEKSHKMETEESESGKNTKEAGKVKIVRGLMPDQQMSIIRSCVHLIGLPVDPDTLHAVLRLTLRLTRDHELAMAFAELGGCRLLLSLTQASAFQGFTSLATLILRHVLEEAATLKDTMEKVVRAATAGLGSALTGVAQGSMGSREMNYVLRVLGPAACRDAEVFKSVAKASLRIGLPVPPANRDADEYEARLVSPNQPQILQKLPQKVGQEQSLPTTGPLKVLLGVLLDALVEKQAPELEEEKVSTNKVKPAQSLAESIQEVVNEVTREITQRVGVPRQDSLLEEGPPDVASRSTSLEMGEKTVKNDQTESEPKLKEEEEKKQRPLLPKSDILRILAELVRSYSGVAPLITQHTFHAGQTELITEDCNVLAFVLDRLLPSCQGAGDKDCPALSRVLLASIAACNHAPDAQTTLVNELKGALQRALVLPESKEKHTRIQALTGLVNTVIESCPSTGHVLNQVFKGQQNTVNNMVRTLLRRGVVVDLARIPHSLDLSSPSMASTVNAALKPLETLSRIVNQPQNVPANKAKVKATGVGTNETLVDETAAEQTATGDETERRASEPEVPNEGDVHIEDVTETEVNTDELEVTEAAEAEEPTMDGDEDQAEALEEVIGELIGPNPAASTESQVLGEIIMAAEVASGRDDGGDIMVDMEMDRNRDSQAASQEVSEDEADEHTDHAEHHQPGHDDMCEPDEDADGEYDDDDHGDDDDDDDDDVDDEDEEDDEGSDMEADNDDFRDLEDTFFGNQDDNDLFVQLEDLFSSGGGQHIVFGGDNSAQIRTYQLPVAVHENENGGELPVPVVPPAPSNVTAAHPLLVRQPEPSIGGSSAARVHRVGRPRGRYHYNPGTQTLHVHYTTGINRQPNPPAILQRLLGPTAAADVLQLTGNLSSTTGPTRLLVANDDLRFLSHPDDDLFEDFLPDNYGESLGTGVVNSVPTALTRWMEEARVLDGDSIHDCVTVLKPEIIEELERVRDKSLAARRERRKKNGETSTDKKEKAPASTTKEDGNRTVAWENSNMEVGESSTATSGASTATADTPPSEVLPPTTSSASETVATTSSVGVSTDRVSQSTTVSTTTSTTSSETPSEQAAMAEANRLATAIVDQVLSTPMPPSASNPTSEASSGTELPAQPAAAAANNSFETPANEGALAVPDAPRRNEGDVRPSPASPAPTPLSNFFRQRLYQLMMSTNPTTGRGSERQESAMDTSVDSTLTRQLEEADSSLSALSQGLQEATAAMSRATAQLQAEANALRERAESLHEVAAQRAENQEVARPELLPLELPPAQTAHASGQPSEGDLAPSGDVITPEGVSNITSSDAVTVHTSGSEPPSTGDIETPPNEVPPSSMGDAAPASSSSQSQDDSQPGPSGTGSSQDGSDLPEGVDPSFLAALPENIRQEVIAEQLRLQRIQQRAQQQNQQAGQVGVTEVNPEFLAALPPSIQEEVLAQQRAEQARLANSSNPPPPDTAVDPASFIASLPSSLRQQVLADMDDSMVAVLPSDLAAEAQTLRRELEERHRRIMQERLFAQAGIGGLARLGTRYAVRSVHRAGGAPWGWGTSQRSGGLQMANNANTVRIRGRHLLDHEALTCLLVLLFVDEPKINTNRLHRVLRNLCYHAQTRAWVIRALLSIMQRTTECRMLDREDTCRSMDKGKSKGPLPGGVSHADSGGSVPYEGRGQQPSWLSISLDAALGCRANVFQVQRASGKKQGSSGSYVTIHSQASPVVCRHVLDVLISLAKSFPSQFLPISKAKETKCAAGSEKDTKSKTKEESKAGAQADPAVSKTSSKGDKSESKTEIKDSSKQESDFWETLLKLDHSSSSRKGKSIQRTHSAPPAENEGDSLNFDMSPLGQLMGMLAHPVIKRSQMLTDRLLRLLGLVSIGLPEVAQRSGAAAVQSAMAATTAATTVVESSWGHRQQRAETTQNTTQNQQQMDQSQEPSRADLSETMDLSLHGAGIVTTSTPLPTKAQEAQDKKKPEEECPVLESQLRLAVEVLTSKSCSEEGLEDATNLLVQLSKANAATREAVLKLLLLGARELGLTVCAHIRCLLEELQPLTAKQSPTEEEGPEGEAVTPGSQAKGTLPDRYNQGNVVVVHAPRAVKASVKSGAELQLPSMSQLTSKASSQQFLLRVLKVILQLREAARAAHRKKDLKKMPDPTGVPSVRGHGQRSLIQDIIIGRNPTLSRRLDPPFTNPIHEQRSSASSSAQPAEQSTAATRTASSAVGQEPQGQQSTGDANSNTTSHTTSQPADQPPAGGAGGSTSQTNEASQEAPPPEPVSQVLTVETANLETLMEVDQPGPSGADRKEEEELVLPRLSEQLLLDELWETLGECLSSLAKTSDHHAVLVLQPAVEAFFIVHAGEKQSKAKETGPQKREDQLAHLNMDLGPMSPQPSSSSVDQPTSSLLSRENSVASVVSIAPNMPPDTQKFLKFADTHRTVLNQILRQSSTPLVDGPFSVLVDHTRVLDFDVKRRYFRQELDRLDEGVRREELVVNIRRDNVFEESFRELHRRSPDEWKHRFYIVFEGEEGQDAGGLLREWYLIISREIFNPNYALFCTSPGDRVTYTINPSSHCNSNHLSYFKFVGRIIAKAIFDNKLLECYFTRSFYKHILGVPVKYTDMESEDYSFYQGLVYLLEHNIQDLGYDLTFSTEIQEFGVTETRDLKPNGHNIPVTEENKREYVKLVCIMKMTGAIRKQLNAFLEGFYDIIPKRLISIFNEQELELLISGLPTIDIDDLKANTEYHKYQPGSLQVQWFWRALRSFDQADRARFLQFVTGTSKVPLQGFSHLEGMNGTQKFQIHRDDRSTDRLPAAHTCFNQLDLPVYETYDKLRHMLLLAINECSEGFGLA